MLIKINSSPTTIFDINKQSFELIEVEGGRFMMGSEGNKKEKLIHEVELSSFLMGKYPVTQELWETVMGNNPSKFKDLNRPVEQVSWYQVTEFCNVLSKQLGKEQVYKGSGENIEIDYSANGFRLPTEAQWEYAARGGKQQEDYTYSGGNDAHLVGWYDENSHDETKPVGLKQPNGLGLHDMSGNVWEWCNDWYQEGYKKQNKGIEKVMSWLKTKETLEQHNPTEPEKGTYRVLRGGSWFDYPRYMRVAFGYSFTPGHWFSSIGFRLCLPQF